MRSPSTTIRSRRTPCVAGCWGPMLSTMSDVASPPAPTPTVSSTRPILPRAPAAGRPAPSAGRSPWCLCDDAGMTATAAPAGAEEPFDPRDVVWARVSPRLALARRTTLSITLAVLALVDVVVGLLVLDWA